MRTIMASGVRLVRRALAMGAAILLVTGAPAHAANRVVMIGDSWGAALPSYLEAQFDQHGHPDWDVLNLAIPGATADAYASNAGGVLDVVAATLAATPEAQYVTISLGGNDLVGGYASLGNDVFANIEDDLRTIVARIFSVRPDIQIALLGYDLLKWDKSAACLLLAYNQFQGHVLPWEVNPLFLEIGNRLNAVSQSYANVTVVNEPFGLWGTGQGHPGAPDLFAWSPSTYVAGDDLDCLHLSNAGYTQFAGQIYAKYFKTRLDGGGCKPAAPGAPIAGGLAPILPPIAGWRWWRTRRRRRAR
jgi:lysophospholipase L1-like esterase